GAAEPVDVSFDALLEDGVWRVTSPYSAALDPQRPPLVGHGVTVLRVGAYRDVGTRLRSDFGLDPPEISISLGTVSSRTFTLRFGRSGHQEGGRWYVSAEGMTYVWQFAGRSVELYAAPIEEFPDHPLTRIP